MTFTKDCHLEEHANAVLTWFPFTIRKLLFYFSMSVICTLSFDSIKRNNRGKCAFSAFFHHCFCHFYCRYNFFLMILFQLCVFVFPLIYELGKLAFGCIIKRLWTQTDRTILSHKRILNNGFHGDSSFQDGFWSAADCVFYEALCNISPVFFFHRIQYRPQPRSDHRRLLLL